MKGLRYGLAIAVKEHLHSGEPITNELMKKLLEESRARVEKYKSK